MTSRRAARSVAACAFARLSASDSAKFANNTVNHSHTVTCRMKPGEASPVPASDCTNRIVVRMLPTYTTNMTGLRTCARGESLRSASRAAPRRACTLNRSRSTEGDAPRG
jgi:hypothetical protein